MAEFSTLHIFGYGESQVIGKDYNVKAPNSELTGLQAVVDNVYSKKPADSTATTDYHAINIFHDMFADYQPKQGEGFRVPYEELDNALIQALADEIIAKQPQVAE